MNQKQLLDDFLLRQEQKGRRPQGLRGLRLRVPRLFDYLNETGLWLDSFGAGEALGYQGWLRERRKADGETISARTVCAYLTAASSFFDYLHRQHLILANPFKEIRFLRTEKTIPRNLLKESQVNLLLDHFARFDEEQNLKKMISRYRMHVLCELLYSTALRITEAAELKTGDLDLERGTVRVAAGKGGFARTAFLDEYCKGVLRIYVQRIRPQILTAWHDEALLFGTGWERFGKWANEQLKEACAALGLPQVTCHGFRHAVGFHLLRAGCPLRKIQGILGHRRLRNTEIYTLVEKEDLKKVLDTYHPRRWDAA